MEQELRNSAAYYQLHNQHLLVEYAAKETLKRERMVCENANFIAVVPYWAVWPFEVHLSRALCGLCVVCVCAANNSSMGPCFDGRRLCYRADTFLHLWTSVPRRKATWLISFGDSLAVTTTFFPFRFLTPWACIRHPKVRRDWMEEQKK